jgi:uncharacterized protein YcfL
MKKLLLNLRWLLLALVCLAGCVVETKIRVVDFNQPLILDRVHSTSTAIVGLMLEVSGKAAQPITVRVKCKDAQIQQFEVSNSYSRSVKLDAYSACIRLVFESASFVNSSMTVSYSYTVL